jgi:hypothetical protein
VTLTCARWRRGIAAAARLQAGDGLGANAVSPDVQEAIDETPELDEKTRKARKATMWGSLSLGVGKERDEAEELPFHSKALEQQHWWVAPFSRRMCRVLGLTRLGRLEMIDGKVSTVREVEVVKLELKADLTASIW